MTAKSFSVSAMHEYFKVNVKEGAVYKKFIAVWKQLPEAPQSTASVTLFCKSTGGRSSELKPKSTSSCAEVEL